MSLWNAYVWGWFGSEQEVVVITDIHLPALALNHFKLRRAIENNCGAVVFCFQWSVSFVNSTNTAKSSAFLVIDVKASITNLSFIIKEKAVSSRLNRYTVPVNLPSLFEMNLGLCHTGPSTKACYVKRHSLPIQASAGWTMLTAAYECEATSL